jgi:hypothetical protein
MHEVETANEERKLGSVYIQDAYCYTLPLNGLL